MRLYREADLAKIRACFDAARDGAEKIPRHRLNDALKQMGSAPTKEILDDARIINGVDFDAFVHINDSCRTARVERERKKAGFSDEKIEQFRDLFNTFDKDHSGNIDCS